MSANPISNVCGVVECGDKHAILAHTNVGVEADGDGAAYYYEEFNTLRVDPGLRGKDYVDALLHEWLHARFQDFKEESIDELGQQIADMLYLPEVMRRAGFNP